MSATLLPVDHALVGLVLALSVLEWRWAYPQLVRKIAAGVHGARAKLYCWILFELWLIAAALVGAWVVFGREWIALRFGTGSLVQAAVGVVITVLFALLLHAQRRKILAKPGLVEQVIRRAADVGPLMPRTRSEHRAFMLVSVSAGVWEELFFRGFAMWYFAHWGGTVAAVLLSSMLFGFGHIYLGWKHVVRTAIIGVFFALIALAVGSLWPGMVIHALIDMNSGDLAYRALGEDRADATGMNLAAT